MWEILTKLAKGEISIQEAERLVKLNAIEEVGELAKIDINRHVRKGIPEIVLAEGKSTEEVKEIAIRILKRIGRVILTRLNNEQMKLLQKNFSNNVKFKLNKKARIAVIKTKDFKVRNLGGEVGILTAGTADIPVAEEARIIAEEMGCMVYIAYDVGVAGLHRLISPLKEFVQRDIDVLIVVAGREGALPSVVASLVDIPVIGVPTSIGYGLGEKGLSALMAMLQACSLGLAVVNIDSGVAAGAVAALIANRIARKTLVRDTERQI
jgi:hypothetical protein